MSDKLISIAETVEPIVGGYWGETTETGGGNVRVVRNGDILESGEIGKKVPERLFKEKEIQKASLKLNDVVITISGNVGRVARIKEETDTEGRPFVASNFVKILRAKEAILPAYLFFFLKSPKFQSEKTKYTRGVAIQNLSSQVFEQKFIPNISLAEQERVVALLERAESLRQKRLLADKKMSKLVPTIFNEMFGAKDWEEDTIGNLASKKGAIRTGPFGSHLHHDEFTTEGVPVLGIDNVVSNTFRWGQPRHLPPEKYEKFKKFRVYPGDVLVTIMGTVGRVCVAPDDLPESMSTKHLCVITPDETKINPIFLWATLLYDNRVRRQVKHISKGAIMEGWNSTIIKNLSVSVPPLPEQNEFAKTVKALQLVTKKQEESEREINALLATLLSKSFN